MYSFRDIFQGFQVCSRDDFSQTTSGSVFLRNGSFSALLLFVSLVSCYQLETIVSSVCGISHLRFFERYLVDFLINILSVSCSTGRGWFQPQNSVRALDLLFYNVLLALVFSKPCYSSAYRIWNIFPSNGFFGINLPILKRQL